MAFRRIAFLLGAAWVLARFVILHFLSLRLVPSDPLFNTMALWVGAGSLVVVATFAASAFIEESRRFYIPLLRLSFLLFAVTDALAVVRGVSLTIVERSGEGVAATAQAVFFLTFGILILDLVLLASLLAYRVIDKNGERGETQPAITDDAPKE
jgi:hypothetical protein